MSFLTIERDPVIIDDGRSCEECQDSSDGSAKSKCHSDDFFAYKGAALGLQQETCRRRFSCIHESSDLKVHLKKMLSIFRKVDSLNLVVKLQTSTLLPGVHRYMAVLSSTGSQDTVESAILGFDIFDEKITVGLVLEVWVDMKVVLDGDGGFKVVSKDGEHLFKPVSVQALWAVFQRLNKAMEDAKRHNYFTGGLTHTWVNYYRSLTGSPPEFMKEWRQMEDIEQRKVESTLASHTGTQEEKSELSILEEKIKVKLQELMLKLDLETVTVLELRQNLEEYFERDLRIFRRFIEAEILNLYGQMDSPSRILDHIYLGSSYNASNLEELERNNVTHILNVTREIENFFLEKFEYKNIREFDEEQTQLLPYWEETHRFINEAKDRGTCCLVHCKMGVSRSASTVIAYAMKEYGWKLDYTLQFVKEKRSCVQPNSGFLKQLETYEGILEASAHRHSANFNNQTSPNSASQDSPNKSIHESPFNTTPPSVNDVIKTASTHVSRRLPLALLGESPANHQSDEERPVNVESELFFFKPQRVKRKEGSVSTSVLSNISNRSPISSVLTGGLCSDSNSLTGGQGSGAGPPTRTTAQLRPTFRRFRPDLLEIFHPLEPESVLLRVSERNSGAAPHHPPGNSRSPPAVLGHIPAISDPCLANSELESPVMTPGEEEKENETSGGGVCVIHRKRCHSRYRDDNSWIRMNSSEEVIPVVGQHDDQLLTTTCVEEGRQENGTLGSLPELRSNMPTSREDKETASYKRYSLNETSNPHHSFLLQSLFSAKSRSRSTSGGADMDTIMSESPTSPINPDCILVVQATESPAEHRRAASWGVYESEQIDIEPGLVQRTKKVIEATGGSGNVAPPPQPCTTYSGPPSSRSAVKMSLSPVYATEPEEEMESVEISIEHDSRELDIVNEQSIRPEPNTLTLEDGKRNTLEEESIRPVSELVGRFTRPRRIGRGHHPSSSSCSEGEISSVSRNSGTSPPDSPERDGLLISEKEGGQSQFGASKFYMTM